MVREAIREGWPQVVERASAVGAFPKRVQDEVRRYLACGILRHGFAELECTTCKQSAVIAFSCKTRGWCPSCAARRAHETAAHLLDVLPKVAFRQWTLSVPFALRFPLVKDVKLLKTVERCLTKAIFFVQRRRARALGGKGKPVTGAVSQVQLFASSLALQPHWHLLVPEGVWSEGVFAALPPPSQEDVEAVLKRALKHLKRAFEKAELHWPEDAFEKLQAEAAQLTLKLPAFEEGGGARRLAVGAGFSLHADTKVPGHDREGLGRLLRYGARGPIAESRLTRRDDGKYVYQTKRKGVVLVLTAEQLTRRLLGLIPPARLHLTNFHGAFSSHSKDRATVTSSAANDATPSPPTTPSAAKPKKPRRPRLDFATLLMRTFAVDLWTCRCGGKRKLLAVITGRRKAEERLLQLGLPPAPRPLPVAQAPPQLQLAV